MQCTNLKWEHETELFEWMFQIVYRSMWTVVGNERDSFFISIMKFIMKGNKHRVTYAQFEENTVEKSGNWEFWGILQRSSFMHMWYEIWL